VLEAALSCWHNQTKLSHCDTTAHTRCCDLRAWMFAIKYVCDCVCICTCA
jgi:hypothetical protein